MADSITLRFWAAVHTLATEGTRLATFYLMNTSPNRNGWAVTEKALDEALPTLLGKPLGCIPGYRVDHIHEPIHVGRWVRVEKPDGYALATALKEAMRRAECPTCRWTGHVDTREGEWRTTCPQCQTPLRPLLHIPYDRPLLNELNSEHYELTKTGRLSFSHPEGTHDDRFWALALAVQAAHSNTRQRPTAKLLR